MKNLLILFLISLSITSYSQTDSCEVILVKKLKPTSKRLVTENYHPDGFLLVKNAIYNFTISGKTYKMYRIKDIQQDTFKIVSAADSTPEHTFLISDLEKLTLFSLDNGVYGMPIKITRKKYDFSIIKIDSICGIDQAKICESQECDFPIIGL